MHDLRAMFVTTATSEPCENVKSWAYAMGPSGHVVFDINGPPNDAEILRQTKDFVPDLIFYTGATDGDGIPSDATLQKLRAIAPSVILQGDMADPPWHPLLAHYRKHKCFDLQVAMDGVRGSPVDLVTLTPLDLPAFARPPRRRNIVCGFAGNLVPRARFDMLKKMHGTEDLRSALLHTLGPLVQLRERELGGSYASYVAFLKRCRLIINTSWAGSGTVHHMKGKVLEGAFAGCALLEMKESPIADWFPDGSYFSYGSAREAATIINCTDLEEFDRRAAILSRHALEHYTPEKIYQSIVERLGIA